VRPSVVKMGKDIFLGTYTISEVLVEFLKPRLEGIVQVDTILNWVSCKGQGALGKAEGRTCRKLSRMKARSGDRGAVWKLNSNPIDP